MPDPNQDFIDAVNGQQAPASTAGDPNQDFIDAVGGGGAQPGGTPEVKTPHTDGVISQMMNFARKPSPAWLQPFEKFVTRTPLAPKELFPSYWIGKEVELTSKFLPQGGLRTAGEIAGGAFTGMGEAGSAFTTPANVGLALTTGGLGRVGTALISGIFLGQAIKGTPEQWRALHAATTWGDKARIAVGMGASYLPALGVIGGAFGRGELPPAAPAKPGAAIPPPPVEVSPFIEAKGEEVGPVIEQPTAPEGGESDAIKRSDAQIQAREAPLGVEARPEGDQPRPGDSDYVKREAEGKAGEVPPEPVPTAPAVAPAAPEPAYGARVGEIETPYFVEKHGGVYAVVDRRRPGSVGLITPSLEAAQARKSQLDEEFRAAAAKAAERLQKEARPEQPEDQKDHASVLMSEIQKLRQDGIPVPLKMTQELEQLQKGQPPKEKDIGIPAQEHLSPEQQAKFDALSDQATDLKNELANYIGKPLTGEASKKYHDIRDRLWDTFSQIHKIREDSGEPRDLVIIGGGAAGLKAAGHAAYEGIDALVLEKEATVGGQAKRSGEIVNVGAEEAGITGREYFRKKELTARNRGAQIRTGVEVANLIPRPDGGVDVVTKNHGVIPARRVAIVTGAKINIHPGFHLAGWGNAERLSRLSSGKTGMVYGAGNSATQAVVTALRRGAKKIIMVSRHAFGPEASDDQVKRINLLAKEGKVELVTDTINNIKPNPDGSGVIVGTKGGKEFPVAHVENFLDTDLNTGWLPAGIEKVAQPTKPGRQPKPGPVRVLGASLKTTMPGVYAGGDIRESLPGEDRPRRIDMAEGDAAGIAARAVRDIYKFRKEGKLPSWMPSKAEQEAIDVELKTLKDLEHPVRDWEEHLPAAGEPGTTSGSQALKKEPTSTETPPPRTGKTLPQRQSSDPVAVEAPPGHPPGQPLPPEVATQSVKDNILIESLKDKPRALTPEEDFALMQREKHLQGKLDVISADQAAANDEGDFERMAENDVKISELLDKLQDVHQARRSGKLIPGQAPPIIQGNFSLEQMIKQKRAVNRGTALTPEEIKQVEEAHNNIVEKENAVEAYKATPEAKSYWEQLSKAAQAVREGKGDKLKPLLFDPAHMAKMAEAERAKQKWLEALEKDRRSHLQWWEKTPDWLLKWRRSFVISGLHSIVKLASAAVEGTIILPARDIAGGVIGKLPFISRVAKMAPREGGFNIRAEAAAQAEMWKNLISDMGKNIKGEKPDYEAVFGKYRNLPPELQNYVGYLHGALKSPLARNEFTRSLVKRTEYAARHGVDITDPLVQMEIGRQAVEDSQFWRFQNKNMAANVYRRLIGSLERQGAWGKASSVGLQAELPVVVVPTNILARTFEGVFGTIPGMYRLGKAYARGIENLTPQQADLIMRNLKTGSLGLALTMVGFFNPQMFGGFFRPGMKKRKGEVGFGETKIGDVTIPAYLQDNPFLILPQFGATMRQVADLHLRKRDKDTAGMWLGMWSAVTGAASSQPFVRESIDITNAVDPRRAGDIIGEHARSYLVPMVVQQVASMTDPAQQRYASGFSQRMMLGIPGMREELPTVLPEPQQLGIRRRGLVPGRHLRARR